MVLPRVTMLIIMGALAISCASPRQPGMIAPASQVLAETSAEPLALVKLYVASTRARAEEPGIMFSGNRAQSVGFAKLDISVPASHEEGFLERPRRGQGDPARHFMAVNPVLIDETGHFDRDLKTAIAEKPRGERDILIFVHGFNNTFDEAAYRFAQIVHDAPFDGVPIYFAWASRGSPLGYIYDRDSATAARDGLQRTLEIAAASGVERIHIMAHSMGNWIALETLRQMQISGDRKVRDRLGEVILASPDVDVDVFKTQMRLLSGKGVNYTMLVSADDRALGLSSRLAGNQPRAGVYTEDEDIAALGVTVINVTDVSVARGNSHVKFSSVPGVIELLGAQMHNNSLPVNGEVGLSDRLLSIGQNLGNVATVTTGVVITPPRTVTASSQRSDADDPNR